MNDNAKLIMKIKTILILVSITIILAIGLYGIAIEPRQVELHRVYIRDAALAEVLKDKVVVQISDLHMEKIGEREEAVIKTLEELKPDLIFLTGEYVKWDSDYEPALEFLSRLRARVGIWAVMGDYDYSNSRKSCLFCHAKGNGKTTNRHRVKFLRSGFEEIDLEGGRLWLGGLDSENRQNDGVRERIKLPEGMGAAIILCHDPLAFDWLDGQEDVLMLAGDTHGGQVPVPGWAWKILGCEKNAKYSYGLYEKRKAKMFVSKGVGTSHVPVRILRKPEVVVIHFVAGSKEQGAGSIEHRAEKKTEYLTTRYARDTEDTENPLAPSK